VGTDKKWNQYEVPRGHLWTSKEIQRLKTKTLGNAPICIIWAGPDLFPLYIHWLKYRKVVTFFQSSHALKAYPVEDYRYLMMSYVFAEYIKDEIWQDMVISAILQRLRTSDTQGQRHFVKSFTGDLVRGVYRYTAQNSPLRSFVTASLVCFGTHDDFLRLRDQGGPGDFFADLNVHLSKAYEDLKSVGRGHGRTQAGFSMSTKSGPQEPDCIYHLHVTSGTPCWRKIPEFAW
jgi:hypothetical protein